MSLNFPHEPDTRLRRAPLIQVICQVQFPPILSISRVEPIEFQERVRARFPELEVGQGLVIQVPRPGMESIIAPEPQPRVYRFNRPDDETSISLAVDFYSLSTNRYSYWERFEEDLDLVQEAFRHAYEAPYSTRIGLRYINRITLANTGKGTIEEMLELIRPELTAQVRSQAWTDPLIMISQIVLPDRDGKLTLRTAYGRDREDYFILDFDYFEEGRLPFAGLSARCNAYHQVIYDAFKWSLKNQQIDSFDPAVEG